MDDATALRRRQTSNKVVARLIPGLLICIVGYASWVFVGPLCVNYLINTPREAMEKGVRQRIGVGIALAIVYFVLLLPMAVAYLRILLVVTLDPGFTPRHRSPPSKPHLDSAPDAHNQTTTTRSCAPTTIADRQEPTTLDYEGILKQRVPAPRGIEEYYTKDVFVCDPNGLPLWCATCANWKPDRSHHCSDVGRCVTKMDHFCPWVGGAVGENSYKFFVQFTAYAALFCAYTLAALAVFVAERKQALRTVDVHWVVALGLAGFFGLFTFGLAVMSTHMVLVNRTTIENIDAGSNTMYLAVLLPPELQNLPNLPSPPLAHLPSRSAESARPLSSDFDDPAHSAYFSPRDRPSRERKPSRSAPDPAAQFWQGTVTYPLFLPPDRPPLPAPELRTFAILRTPPGLNPWNLGLYHNFISVFGPHLHDWVLPIRHPASTTRGTDISFYALGWEFEELLEDARLVQPVEFMRKARRRGSSGDGRGGGRRRKRVLSEGWRNGERPDGWDMEKEVRRARKRRERRGREWDG